MGEYTLLKVLHVLSVIVAVGANVTYAAWLARAGSNREHVLFAIRGIRWLDRRLALPGYLVAFITGVGMVLTGAIWTFEARWIQLSILLFVATAVAGVTLFAPAVRRQLAAAERDTGGADYAAAAAATRRLALATTAVVVLIAILMVTKPAL